MNGHERMKKNHLTSHTISRASGILILSLLPRTTVPVDNTKYMANVKKVVWHEQN